MMWNWQQADWPHFTYDGEAIAPLEADFLRESGILIGAFRHLKAPGLDFAKRRGWESVVDMLDGRDPGERGREMKLGEEGAVVSYSPDKAPHWVQVDIQGLRIERVRDFGRVYLGLALWRRLGLHQLLEELFEPGKEQVELELIACILVIARFCANKSELEVAQRWHV